MTTIDPLALYASNPAAVQSQGVQAVFGIATTTPPPLDSQIIMPRSDEVAEVLSLLSEEQTGAVVLTGAPGIGKSILAALIFQRLIQEKQAGRFLARYMIWLGIDNYTTLPDLIAAILRSVNVKEPGFALMKPEQQISALLRALRRAQEPAFIVLDQFESLLHPEGNPAARGAVRQFLEMLQADIGASRVILTSYSSPYSELNMTETRARSYTVPRISASEGVALLERSGIAQSSPDVQSASEDFSLVWQRCGGHVYSLVLFAALVRLSNTPTSYLLNSPDYQAMWTGEVPIQLMKAVYHFFDPIQYILMRTLALYSEPVSLAGLAMTVAGPTPAAAPGSPAYALLERELGPLVELSLIQVSPGLRGPVFAIHHLLRRYVSEHYLDGIEPHLAEGYTAMGLQPPALVLNRPDAAEVALAMGHMQAAGYYRQLVQDSYIPREQRRGPQDVDPMIWAIRHLCLGKHWQPACDILFAEGLHEGLVQWGAWNVLIGLYTSLLPPLGALPSHDQALVGSHVATLYGRMDEVQQSAIFFEQTLAMQRQIGDLPGEIATLVNQGELLRGQGDYAQAHANFDHAQRLNEKVQSVPLQCIILHNMGLLYQSERNYQSAMACYQGALQLAYGPKAEIYRGMILTNLGMVIFEQGGHLEGLSILLFALQLRQGQNDPAVLLLEVFLKAVEQKMGASGFAALCQEAVQNQQRILAQFASPQTQNA